MVSGKADRNDPANHNDILQSQFFPNLNKDAPLMMMMMEKHRAIDRNRFASFRMFSTFSGGSIDLVLFPLLRSEHMLGDGG